MYCASSEQLYNNAEEGLIISNKCSRRPVILYCATQTFDPIHLHLSNIADVEKPPLLSKNHHFLQMRRDFQYDKGPSTRFDPILNRQNVYDLRMGEEDAGESNEVAFVPDKPTEEKKRTVPPTGPTNGPRIEKCPCGANAGELNNMQIQFIEEVKKTLKYGEKKVKMLFKPSREVCSTQTTVSNFLVKPVVAVDWLSFMMDLQCTCKTVGCHVRKEGWSKPSLGHDINSIFFLIQAEYKGCLLLYSTSFFIYFLNCL